MNGPKIICAGCGRPTTIAMPICAWCGGKPPEPFCALCESALDKNSMVAPTDDDGLHYTKTGGYAGPCAKYEES